MKKSTPFEQAILGCICFLGLSLPSYAITTAGRLMGSWYSMSMLVAGAGLGILGVFLELRALRLASENDTRVRAVIGIGVVLGVLLWLQAGEDPKGYIASIVTILTGALIAITFGEAGTPHPRDGKGR